MVNFGRDYIIDLMVQGIEQGIEPKVLLEEYTKAREKTEKLELLLYQRESFWKTLSGLFRDIFCH